MVAIGTKGVQWMQLVKIGTSWGFSSAYHTPRIITITQLLLCVVSLLLKFFDLFTSSINKRTHGRFLQAAT